MSVRPAGTPGLALIESTAPTAAKRLHELIRHREQIHTSFHAFWQRIERIGSPEAIEAWSASAAELLHAHAGIATLVSFAAAAERVGRGIGLDGVAALGREAAEICRNAGMWAAEAAVAAIPSVVGPGEAADDALVRYRAITEVARVQPGCVRALLAVAPEVARATTADAFAAWIGAGIRATAGASAADAAAYFSLRTPLSRRMLAASGGRAYAAGERVLVATFIALWGIRPIVRARDFEGETAPSLRTSIAGQVILVPPVPPRLPSALAERYYEAALAHIGAHARFTPRKFKTGELKPVSIALVSAIEDARVEALAMREMPGLRRLWAPFHATREPEAPSSSGLIARLARALFHLDGADGDPWVTKGHLLFLDRAGRFDDPMISREIASIIGNDLGQMRLPFNAKTYLVEPAYRDDNLGLWEFADETDRHADVHEVAHESVRIEKRNDPGDPDPSANPDDVEERHGARPAGVAPPAPVVVRYPEWDYTAGILRPDWTTVREAIPVAATGAGTTVADMRLAGRIKAIVRRAAIGRSVRRRRQWEGEQVDLDAAIEAVAELRRRQTPDPRVFQRRVRHRRDLAALLLIDASESTRKHVAGTRARIVDLEIEAGLMVSQAMALLGDAHAVWAFRSAGRDDVTISPLKGFAEPASVLAARAPALEPALSTRLGAALRHATAALAGSRALRRLLLVVTDGQPYDIDVDDALYLAEDARHAVREARDRGIDVYCVGLGTEDSDAGKRIFGARHHLPAAHLGDLPARLAMLYFRLALR